MKNKLIELLKKSSFSTADYCSRTGCKDCIGNYENGGGCFRELEANYLIANGVTISTEARPLKEWHEDIGDVLWWKFPIEEPPYVGSPLDLNWPSYHTHWTPIVVPQPPKEEV